MLRRSLVSKRGAIAEENMRVVCGVAELVVGYGAVDNLEALQPMGEPE